MKKFFLSGLTLGIGLWALDLFSQTANLPGIPIFTPPIANPTNAIPSGSYLYVGGGTNGIPNPLASMTFPDSTFLTNLTVALVSDTNPVHTCIVFSGFGGIYDGADGPYLPAGLYPATTLISFTNLYNPNWICLSNPLTGAASTNRYVLTNLVTARTFKSQVVNAIGWPSNMTQWACLQATNMAGESVTAYLVTNTTLITLPIWPTVAQANAYGDAAAVNVSNRTIAIGPGVYPAEKATLAPGETLIGAGPGATIIGYLASSNGFGVYAGNNNTLQNLSVHCSITAMDGATATTCSNLSVINCFVSNPFNVDGYVSSSANGNRGGAYGATFTGDTFTGNFDFTASIRTATFNNCTMNVTANSNNVSSLRPYSLQYDDCFYIINGGTANLVVNDTNYTGGNEIGCVVIGSSSVAGTGTNATLILQNWPHFNHWGTGTNSGVAIANYVGCTNIYGDFFDNGSPRWIQGTNIYTSRPANWQWDFPTNHY